MCTMVLDNTSYIHAFLGADTMDHPFKEYMDTVFIPTRVAKGIPIDVIAAFTEADHAYVRTADTSLRRIICIDEPFFTLAGELFLYAPGKLALCLYSNQELLGISITSDHLYQSLYSLFQLVWKLKT